MPTEELFGAYHYLATGDNVVTARKRLRSLFSKSEFEMSDAGLREAMSGQIISRSSDRHALARMLKDVAA